MMDLITRYRILCCFGTHFVCKMRIITCLFKSRVVFTCLAGLAILLISLNPVFAEFVDDDEIVVDDRTSNRRDSGDDDDAKENRAYREQQKMKQWLKQLQALKRSKKEDRLVSLVSKILNKSANNIQALNTLGVFYLRNGKTQLAKIIFTRALKKHPKNSSLHANLAIIALKEGKPEEAVKGFQKSLDYRYNNYSAAANLGTLYMKAYEYDSALEYLSLAYSRAKLKLSLNHREVVKTGNNYAVALAWSGNFKKSEDIFEELIKKNPGSVELLLNYAILLGKDMKKREESYRFLQKADMMDKSGRYARKIKALREHLKKGNKVAKQKFLYLARIY